APRDTVYLVGWLSDTRLLVMLGNDGELDVFDTQHDAFVPAGLTGVSDVDLSPDHRWVWYRTSTEGPSIFVAPSDQLQRARKIELAVPLNDRTVGLAWRGPFSRREYLDIV